GRRRASPVAPRSCRPISRVWEAFPWVALAQRPVRPSWRACGAAICVHAVTDRVAHADVRSDTEAMVRLMRDLRYEEAVGRGLHALREAGPEDQRQLGGTYRLLGTAYFLLGDETHARGAWVQLFATDPDAKPPEDASPKLR